MRYAALTCMLAALGTAGYWSLRLAWADWLSRGVDPAQVARAVALSPGNADFRVKLARVLDKNGADPASALEAAALLNPRDAGVWMRLGIAAESNRDYARAERDLLEAARVSRRFEPRWTLANYYFRRNDAGHFWPWVRQSLLVGSVDFAPVFTLCWAMSQDAELIWDQALPERRPALNAYLWFLMRQSQLSAGVPVARKLAAMATKPDRSALLAFSDRMIESSESAAALEIWNAMCARGLLPYKLLDPDRGASLTDGSFSAEPAGGGFGWRLASEPGIACGRNTSPGYLWLSLSGSQAAHCEPLSEYLALVPGKPYRLRFRYRTSDIPAESGLRWQVIDTRNGAALASRSAWLSSPAWKDDVILFTAPATSPLARLVFTYHAVPGTPRLEGSVLLSDLRLERLP